MSSKFILFIILPIFFINSCYKPTEWEDVTADYDPVLNIAGIISLDENIESFVGVYRTTELSEVSMEFSGIVDTIEWEYDNEKGFLVDSLFDPAGFIDSAIVTIFSGTDSFTFNFNKDERTYVNNDFKAEENTEYNLRVEVNGFDMVTGKLTTPFIPELDTLQIPDSLTASTSYEIFWINNQDSSKTGLLIGNLIESHVWCGGEFYSLIDFPSEKSMVLPQWCDPETVSIGDIDNDYGIRNESNCICDIEKNDLSISSIRVFNSENGTCICDDNNPPTLVNNENVVAVADLGGCEQAVAEFGCSHTFDDGTFLIVYCPVTCGGCEEIVKNEAIANNIDNVCESVLGIYCPATCGICDINDSTPLDNRIWSIPDYSLVENYSDIEIDSLRIELGYCGDGNPDNELLHIRLMAMDDNYYRYFAQERFKEFSNFLFEYGGTAGRSVGIEGGFGVFGAFASDTLSRVIVP